MTLSQVMGMAKLYPSHLRTNDFREENGTLYFLKVDKTEIFCRLLKRCGLGFCPRGIR